MMLGKCASHFTNKEHKIHQNMANTFTKPTDTDWISEHSLLIGGIELTALYHSRRPNPFGYIIEKGHENDLTALKVMFLMHGRWACSDTNSTPLAVKLLSSYYELQSREPLIVLTWDHRNHGKRTVDHQRNLSWNHNNVTHAVDMMSFIDGAVIELAAFVKFLPCYLPLLSQFNTKYIVGGVSMGGHAAIRATVTHPELWNGCLSIVGSFDISSLLLNRLHDFGQLTKMYDCNYDEIRKVLDETKYPKQLFELVAGDDKRALKSFPDVKTFALFGAEDTSVPPMYSNAFLAHHGVVMGCAR